MSRKKLFFYATGTILILVFLSIGLIAWLSPKQGKADSQSTATTASNGPKKLCGNITLTPTGTLSNFAKAQEAKHCFWQAFRRCHPALLTLTINQMAAVTTHTFSIKQQQSSCIVSDVQQVSISSKGITQRHTYTCARVQNTSSGLRQVTGVNLRFVNCGDAGTIDIPSS